MHQANGTSVVAGSAKKYTRNGGGRIGQCNYSASSRPSRGLVVDSVVELVGLVEYLMRSMPI